MSTLPKSVVVGGRRYPTWALSSGARQQLTNLERVDAHIAQLKDQLAYYTVARKHCLGSLSQALPVRQPPTVRRYYWQMASPEWAQQSWTAENVPLLMRDFDASERSREGDCLLIYVKGYGFCGWGEVCLKSHSTQHLFVWRSRVKALSDALPAKTLKEYALRHPTRAFQRLPENAHVEALLSALEARSSMGAL
ncbi:hypothetical protein [Halomonas citrativorans]|uniref:hypothetical protein n=1 Tax=Halomonas citrativorans TaxID=2742612 RepID=UPI0015946477|nr:hypothetical protein [Halomonas citrativorans]